MQKLTQNRPKPTCKMQNMVIHGSIEELLVYTMHTKYR